jgi:SAM-dependent methyltransferase
MAAGRGRLTARRHQAGLIAREAAALRGLPPAVIAFYARAWWTAWRTRDRFTLDSATRPSHGARLLALAAGHRSAAELGTGTAWTAIALAAADPARRVVSYDPVAREERERYLALVPAAVRARIELRAEPAEAAEAAPASVGFLFVDCAHDRETTANAFRAWRDAVAPGGVAAFHDYGHPEYPGVREAVAELGLDGREEGGLFVWRQPASAVNGTPPRSQ